MTKRIVTFDTETTTFQKGNPFSRRNKLCYVGVDVDRTYLDYPIEYSLDPYGHHLAVIKNYIESADLLVGFNLKFDLHWIKRYVPSITFNHVWDCQLAEFILLHQKSPYPSLDQALARHGLPAKLDLVKSLYWEHGLDTTDVPEDTLRDYLLGDVTGTRNLYELQLEEFKRGDPRMYMLFKLQCADLLVLQEMEWNGMLYDVESSLRMADECQSKIDALEQKLVQLVGTGDVNFGSSDHLSCILFGGDVPVRSRVPTERTLKDGTVKFGERWGTTYLRFERLCNPPRGSENAATKGLSDDDLSKLNQERLAQGKSRVQRIYSVGEPVLRNVKTRGQGKRIIELLLERSELSKLVSTYYRGLPDIIEEKDWEPGIIHGQINQCVAATGRLSSSAPNLQNFSGDIKPLFRSRFD